uniref:Uncharacterized protein n=1 Tax=Anguilla anguilla TaxID=7936 RepID=A0A0E9WJT0_ANGAN
MIYSAKLFSDYTPTFSACLSKQVSGWPDLLTPHAALVVVLVARQETGARGDWLLARS